MSEPLVVPTVDDFRALARSSPWRWTSARFTVRWSGRSAGGPVRAWLRRPDGLRVETLSGELIQPAANHGAGQRW